MRTAIRVFLFILTIWVFDLGIVKAEESAFSKYKASAEILVKAQKLDLLYDLDWRPPKEPKVVVGSGFYKISFGTQENLILTINCFLMAGNDKQFVNFDVLDWKTGKRIGRFADVKFKMD